MKECSQHQQALIMALAALLKRSLTLLVEVLMGIAVLDVQWVSRGVTGLLGMWDRHHGSNRGADGCVEAVFSVLGSQGGEAAGDTTTKTISAHVCEGLCKQSIPSLLTPTDRLCSEAGLMALFPISSVPCWSQARTLQCLLEWVHEQHMAACC